MSVLLGNVASLLSSVLPGQASGKVLQEGDSFENQLLANGAFIAGLPFGFLPQFNNLQPSVNDQSAINAINQPVSNGGALQTIFLQNQAQPDANSGVLTQQSLPAGEQKAEAFWQQINQLNGSQPNAESVNVPGLQNLQALQFSGNQQSSQSLINPQTSTSDNVGQQINQTDQIAQSITATPNAGGSVVEAQGSQFGIIAKRETGHQASESKGPEQLAVSRWADSQQVGTVLAQNDAVGAVVKPTEILSKDAAVPSVQQPNIEDKAASDAPSALNNIAPDSNFIVNQDSASIRIENAPHEIKKDAVKVATSQDHLVDDVALTIASKAKEGVHQIKIQLHPAELGRVDVKLDFNQGALSHITISADRSDTLDALQRDVKTLERSLADAGIKSDGTNLSFDFRQQHQQRGMDFGGQQQGERQWSDDASANGFETATGDVANDESNMGYSVQHYRLQSGLDISV